MYLRPPLQTREDLEGFVRKFWDATTAQWIADCPRKGEYAIERGLVLSGEAPQLVAGRALHAGLDTLYCVENEDAAREEVLRVWNESGVGQLPPGHKFGHIHEGHLEIVFKNYLSYRRRADTFQVLRVKLSDLNLERVVGAVLRLGEDDSVVLGESKIIIEFDIDGKPFFYCGRPDLPIVWGGERMCMDHKSTSSYLSDWYFEQFRFSNQLRGYCAMLGVVLGLSFTGAVINGIYVGDKAALDAKDSKATKFARYGPYPFRPSHLEEAIRNQTMWQQTLGWYRKQGYFPQHSGRICQGCSYADLCAASPRMREAVIQTMYRSGQTEFLDL